MECFPYSPGSASYESKIHTARVNRQPRYVQSKYWEGVGFADRNTRDETFIDNVRIKLILRWTLKRYLSLQSQYCYHFVCIYLLSVMMFEVSTMNDVSQCEDFRSDTYTFKLTLPSHILKEKQYCYLEKTFSMEFAELLMMYSKIQPIWELRSKSRINGDDSESRIPSLNLAK